MQPIFSSSITETDVDQSFETLDGAKLGALAGAKVLLEFEGSETIQLEHGEQMKIGPMACTPSNLAVDQTDLATRHFHWHCRQQQLTERRSDFDQRVSPELLGMPG